MISSDANVNLIHYLEAIGLIRALYNSAMNGCPYER